MIKVKLTEPKEPQVNISLDKGTAKELLKVLDEYTGIDSNLKELKAELKEVL